MIPAVILTPEQLAVALQAGQFALHGFAGTSEAVAADLHRSMQRSAS